MATVAASFALDQVTKHLAIAALLPGPVNVGFIRFRLVANRGIFMGFPAPTVLVVFATLVVVAMALRTARQPANGAWVGYGIIAGGALGNLLDRFLQRQLFPPNAVVDWISFGGMTFNIADVFLVAGVVVLLRNAPSPGASSRHRQPSQN